MRRLETAPSKLKIPARIPPCLDSREDAASRGLRSLNPASAARSSRCGRLAEGRMRALFNHEQRLLLLVHLRRELLDGAELEAFRLAMLHAGGNLAAPRRIAQVSHCLVGMGR